MQADPLLAPPGTRLSAPAQAAPRQELPAGFKPWWRPLAIRALRAAPDQQVVDLDALIISALAYSPRVRAVSEDVLIQETAVLEAAADFDIRAFSESKFFRKSEPIGNILETGGPPRLREEDWGFSAGVRKRTPLGGSFELAQRIGIHDSNSGFFVPPQQGNARMVLSYNQPLLNGFGRVYNRSLIVLAEFDTAIAVDETSAALQQHLLTVAEAYWELYLQRCALVQRFQHLERARVILDELERRRDIDALESQIVRARAAVAARQAELVRAAANIQNTEALIRALTNAPELLANPQAELIPTDHPASVHVDVNLQDAIVTALQHRPEIDAAAQEIRAASIRLNMSRNELLPALDVVLETYVMGLDADYDIGQSFADQFGAGEPSYTAGLVFEVPLHRRAAKARLQRRGLELRRLTAQYEDSVQMLLADVEVVVRDVHATHEEMVGKYQAMMAAQAEVEYATRRWLLLGGEDRSASLLLEDLLAAQDRLVVEEFGFALAQRDFTISQTLLKRATGTLLAQEGIEPIRTCQGGLPQLQFEKRPLPALPAEVLPAPEPRTARERDAATLRR
jgi:outer membrane protein TolC